MSKRIMLEADYSSQEMRILAYLAKETALMDVFMVCPECNTDFRPTDREPMRPWQFRVHCKEIGHKAMDLHQGTAAKVFKVDYDKVTKQQRTFAKRVNFGLNYGQGPSGLAEVLGITIGEAITLIDDYMKAFPAIRVFQQRTEKLVRSGAKIPNAYGRWRHAYGVREMYGFAEEKEYNKRVSAMYRSRVNYPIQSSPADIMGNVAIALYDLDGVLYEDWKEVEAHVLMYEHFGFHPVVALDKMGSKCHNLVHDSMLWTHDRAVKDEATKIITETMEMLPWKQLEWFLPVDTTFSTAWGGKKE